MAQNTLRPSALQLLGLGDEPGAFEILVKSLSAPARSVRVAHSRRSFIGLILLAVYFSRTSAAGAEVDVWYGFFAPRNTPGSVTGRLGGELRSVLEQAELKGAFSSQGLEAAASTPIEPGTIEIRAMITLTV